MSSSIFSVHDLGFCQMYSFPFWNFLSLRRRTHSFSSLVRLPPQKTANRQSANPAKLDKNSPSFEQLHRRMVYFTYMNGMVNVSEPTIIPWILWGSRASYIPTSPTTRPPRTFHRRRPAPWCWHMHMLASGRLNFWRLGSWGFGKIACWEGRKGGGVFWWKIFFC